jgi:hypothetical protein
MASKLFVNNTGYQINGNLVVRKGAQPGTSLNSVQFVLSSAMGSQLFVQYGDVNHVFVDQLEISSLANGGYIISNQIVVTRGSQLDDLFNTNDTITIALQSQSFVTTGSNTWT